MSAYTAAPVVFERLDGILYRQHGATRWEIGRVGSGWVFTAASGTVFDVSIPRALRAIFDPHDPRFLKAAALHDEMLRAEIDRWTAAGAFNQALAADGVGRAARLAMVTAVAVYRFA